MPNVLSFKGLAGLTFPCGVILPTCPFCHPVPTEPKEILFWPGFCTCMRTCGSVGVVWSLAPVACFRAIPGRSGSLKSLFQFTHEKETN